MATMDLSTNQEVRMQSIYEYAQHMFKPKETFEETDIQGNINLFNSLKTEANSNHGHDSSSLFQVKCLNENEFEVDNTLFSYSSFKKAMDLRTHNRTFDGVKRTIFEDAEYFAKNYRYQLLPITLEPVDESVIQSEHNYSLMSLNSESESEENCSRTMDYSQIKKKNYKRRRTKFREGSDADEELVDHIDCATNGFTSSPKLHVEDKGLTGQEDCKSSSEVDTSGALQPLDLSAAPLVQEEKTDSYLRESPSSIVENDDVAQLDSDKENLNSDLNGILVTITRPDEKENYQPCDLFLNDIARLVPKLIDKDCLEVEILDRTCDRHDEFRKHRLYYVISESTWRLFQKTNERVILTNDQSLGQPLRKAEKEEKPSYLVFDQFSLAKCLADYCQEIGGCFEYTCVEEEKEESERKKEKEEEREEACLKEEEREEICVKEKEEEEACLKDEEKGDACLKEEKKKCLEGEEEEEECLREEEKQGECLKEDEKKEECLKEEEKKEECPKEEGKEEALKEEEREIVRGLPESPKIEETENAEKEIADAAQEEPKEVTPEEPKNTLETIPKEPTEEINEIKQDSSQLDKLWPKESKPSEVERASETVVFPPELEEKPVETHQTPDRDPKEKPKEVEETEKPERVSPNTPVIKDKNRKKPSRGTKRKRKSSIQRKPKNSRTSSGSKPTSESETSQKSDKPVSRKGRKEAVNSKEEEPPNKISKASTPEEPSRKTRSGKVLQEVKTNRSTTKKKDSPGLTRRNSRQKKEEKKTEETGRSLRSHKAAQWKEKVQVWSKTKGRKR